MNGKYTGSGLKIFNNLIKRGQAPFYFLKSIKYWKLESRLLFLGDFEDNH